MDSRVETYEHILAVNVHLRNFIRELMQRGIVHDRSKLLSPEVEVFDEVTPRLRGLTYGSDEYNACLAEMKPALDHHYANNSHHPEFHGYLECNGCFKRFPKGYDGRCDICGYSQFQLRPDVSAMTLLDIVEMLCDWKAATRRHADGDIRKSIEINQKRFGYSDELKSILLNTAIEMGMCPAA